MSRVTVQFEIPCYVPYRQRQLLLSYLRGQQSAGQIQLTHGMQAWRDIASLVFICGQYDGPTADEQLAAIEAQGVQS